MAKARNTASSRNTTAADHTAAATDTAATQLHLIHFDDELWKLDARTIRVGRRGLANARAALARAARTARSADESVDGSDDRTPAAA